jgi:GT2 family glycosyltransferase
MNLERCIRMLVAQTLPSGRFEIVVADNNSSCGLKEVEAVCGTLVRVVPARIQGAGPARNAAVAASRGVILAFTDSDCRPSPDWLENGVAALARADMVGGRVDVDVLDPRNPTAIEAFEMVFAFDLKRYVEKKHFSATCNMFVTRAVFDRVGGFRSGVVEDMDWGHRAFALGYRWAYAPQACVSHPARHDWPDLLRESRRLTDEFYTTQMEKSCGRFRWILRNWLVLVSPFIHAIKVLRSDKLDRPDLRMSALGILFRIRFWRFVQGHRVLFRGPAVRSAGKGSPGV